MESIFDRLCLADIHKDLFRNIVSLSVSEHLFDDLTDDEDAWKSAQKLESETRPPIFTNNMPVINRPFEEADWNRAIGYPFNHASQSRYSDGTYGVWYGGDTVDTTVCETVYHWTNRLLSDAQGFLKNDVYIERRVFKVHCASAMIDLRMHANDYPELLHPTDYTGTHAIGRKLHREGHPGLVTKSARCHGEVYALFNPKVLTDPRHWCYLSYRTSPEGVVVEKTPGETLMIVK